MRRLACLLLFAVTAASPAAREQAAEQPRPNVVLIITDDAGYGDFGSFGATDVRTPAIDSLARDGVRMTDFYANGPNCTSTRAALLTGRYQQRYGLEQPLATASSSDGARGLAASGQSLAQLLKKTGYRTALIGKWHVGYKPEFSPIAHGFDYFFGFKSGFIDYYHHTDADGKPDLFENDEPVKTSGYITDLITERSVDFIRRRDGAPFFLIVAYSAPHWPYQVPDKPSKAPENGADLGPFQNGAASRADYVAMLERADRGVGEIRAALDAGGFGANTFVIFTNDNGGEWLSRNGPLFNHKDTVWEGGIRVPTILSWRGRLPSGTVSSQVGITMDLTATILAATGTPPPRNPRPEGINLLPVLQEGARPIERTLFWRVPGRLPMIAAREANWKLVYTGRRSMLFNIRTDIGEREDVIGRNSDIARRMVRMFQTWERDVVREAENASKQ